MTDRQSWGWMDERTRQRCSNSSASTWEMAELQLQQWRERDARGGRPDLHDLIPYLVVVNLTHCWGLGVGLVVPPEPC